MVTATDRKFWAQKHPQQEWETIKITHPDLATPVRIVGKAFTEQTFGGEVYIPCAMTRRDPQQDGDLVPTASVTFPRALIGDALAEAIKQITPSGWLTPFSATLATWWDSNRATPSKSWDLFIPENGISMNSESVTISFSDDNPMVRSVSLLYDTSVFTGLELQTT